MRARDPNPGRNGRALALAGLGVLILGLGGGALRGPFHTQTPTPSAVAPLHTEPTDPIDEARARLAQFEADRRAHTDFAHVPPANRTHGADPYALARLDASLFVGVLRGASALTLLDSDLNELERVQVPESVIAVSVSANGDIWTGGETSPWLVRFRLENGHLQRREARRVPQLLGFRALVAGDHGVLYALDVHDGALLTLRTHGDHDFAVSSRIIGHGPIALRRVGSRLLVNVLLDHALVVLDLDARGEIRAERARIVHNGPIWGFDVAELPSHELAITATGVEDHPLDRSGDGSFGYVDSFVFQYLLPAQGEPRLLWAKNVSELGVVTPKAPQLELEGARARAFVSGYGSDRAVALSFEPHSPIEPEGAAESFLPGTSSSLALGAGRIGFADPLLDAWVMRRTGAPPNKKIETRPLSADSAPLAPTDERVGEALFFTTLMSPANSSAGRRSRFTCETCHFEGYVDGRVHNTGRDDVRVVTKPLRGLFNNRPHFSRALDADLATVSHHEFRVAGLGSETDPWFTLKRAEHPWLAALGVTESELGPEALRRDLMAFLMGFSHTTNPAVVGREHFSEAERRGAELFRDRCERCHAARLQSDVPQSALAFSDWEASIFSVEGPIVWASAEYQKTGVVPYVHELGARTPSLRRLFLKWPHFTNGSAATLLDVVTRARFDDARFFHDNAPLDATLHAFSQGEARDVVAFLELL